MNGLRKQNGEGSIFQVSENKWISKIALGTRPDGRVIVKQFSGKTEAIVKKKLKDFKKSASLIKSFFCILWEIQAYFF